MLLIFLLDSTDQRHLKQDPENNIFPTSKEKYINVFPPYSSEVWKNGTMEGAYTWNSGVVLSLSHSSVTIWSINSASLDLSFLTSFLFFNSKSQQKWIILLLFTKHYSSITELELLV